MFLKRLEIHGFKSFAAKTILELEPGITAVVGPNGSGKSNLADAIRWALGEQSSKPLRLKKSEDLVFAGTDKQARASLAEVSLLLDNSDGGMAIDFGEVELSRLLYRSGESEYKLARNKVRLNEVQQLLIQAGFGPNSYAVIGQGTIDSFILATPAERKLLFDEASGIRQYELRREQALRKLDATEGNLVRVRDILSELEPRLKTLSRNVAAVKERQEVAAALKHQRSVLLASAEAYLPHQITQLITEIAALELAIKDYRATVRTLEKQRAQAAETSNRAAAENQKQRDRLHNLEVERDEVSGDLIVKRAELQLLLEIKPQTIDSQTETRLLSDIKDAQSKLHTIQKKQAVAEVEERQSHQILESVGREIAVAQATLNSLRRETDETSRHEFVTHALTLLKSLAYGLENGSIDEQKTRLLVHKAGRLLSHASKGQAEVLMAIKQSQDGLNSLMKRRESAQNSYAKIVIKVRSFELDATHLTSRLSETKNQLRDQKSAIDNSSLPSPELLDRRRRHLVQLEAKLAAIAPEIDQLRSQLAGQSSANETDAIFALAADLEATKTKVLEAEARLGQLQLAKSSQQHEQKRFNELRHRWFGQEALPAAPSQEELSTLEQYATQLQIKYESFGDSSNDIVEEYQEVEKRHRFLSTQLGDLKSAETDLRQVITQLEVLIKAKFDAAFSDISAQFSHYFQRLFGGGKAALKLQPDSSGVYGIEIKALPPGKRVESLAMLSGGERSLTGIALLAAILKINPSPFVVMDEVDAALDEANSTRFAEIITEIGRHTQLIVITHNRQTMQAAKVLFGVTMDENHVSRLLSMRLEAAEELAATVA